MSGMAMGRIARVVAVLFSAGGLACGTPAHARDVSAIVIPGKPGVPVVINGYDASYCIVEGDWGLARPGHVTPTIVACPLYVPGASRSAPIIRTSFRSTSTMTCC